MASLNRVQIIGNVGKDPELRYTPGGQAVCSFSVACNETWKDKDGERQERTEWVRVTMWGKLAEVAGEYLTKGKQVYLEGRMQTREWDDKEGIKRYTTEVVADKMILLGGKPGSAGDDDTPPRQKSKGGDPTPQSERQPSKKTNTGFDDMDEEIPF